MTCLLFYDYFSFQQNNIQYELIGIGTALEYFTVVDRSGEVKIRKKLREDVSRQPTYRVKKLGVYCPLQMRHDEVAFVLVNLQLERIICWKSHWEFL